MFTYGRPAVDLNGVWKFCPDPMQRCRSQRWWRTPPKRASTAAGVKPSPASWSAASGSSSTSHATGDGAAPSSPSATTVCEHPSASTADSNNASLTIPPG